MKQADLFGSNAPKNDTHAKQQAQKDMIRLAEQMKGVDQNSAFYKALKRDYNAAMLRAEQEEKQNKRKN